MNDPVDMTKCQPGDLLKMRCGEIGVYVRKQGREQHTVCGDSYEVRASHAGRVFWKTEYAYDVVAIIHPTRAELEEQRRELLVAVKGALAALSQPMTYPADIAAAKRWLADAAIKAEATHG